MNIVLLGAPGAGKGSQATRLRDAWNLPHISTGDMLREARAAGTELGKQAAAFMDKGELVPDDVIIGVALDRLGAADAQQGFLLDGFPRTLSQAFSLVSQLSAQGRTIDHAVQIDVPEEVLVERLAGRRSCPECKRPYHVKFSPPKQDGICDDDGTELVHREDDREDAVRNRLRVYVDQSAPLVAFFDQRGVLQRVDGSGTPDEVFARIENAVRSAGAEAEG